MGDGELPRLVVFLLGGLRLEAGGIVRDVSRRKVRALLAWLAMAPRPCGRDELAEVLFPLMDRDRAYADLRQSLSYLRDEVGDALVESPHRCISVRTGSIHVDVHEFRRLAGGTAEGGETGRLEKAAAVYRGPFLDGFYLRECAAFEQWQTLQAEELAREYRQVLVRLHDLRAAEGAHEAAAGLARAIVDLDPLDELARRRIMRTLAAAGRRREALAQFDELSVLLDRELAAGPEEETVALAEAIRGAAGLARRDVTLAVLPFANLSEDPGQAYFCQGLCQDLAVALAALPGLRVTAPGALRLPLGADVDATAHGRARAFTHVLEGSVRRVGTTVRVSVQLRAAGSGHTLWARKLDRELADVFGIQDDIVGCIVTELDVRLAGGEQARLWRASTRDGEAYDLLLRARHLPVNPAGLVEAVDLLDRALARDPGFAAALCYKGAYCLLQARLSWVGDTAAALRQAHAAFAEALRLDGSCADAHCGMGAVHFVGGRHREAEKEYATGLSLGPCMEMTLLMCTAFYTWKKDYQKALWAARRAKQVCPFPTSQAWAWEVVCLRYLGRLEEALAVSTEALRLFPNGLDILVNRASVCFLLGRVPELEAARRRVLEIQPDFSSARWYAATGVLDEAQRASYTARLRAAGFP